MAEWKCTHPTCSGEPDNYTMEDGWAFCDCCGCAMTQQDLDVGYAPRTEVHDQEGTRCVPYDFKQQSEVYMSPIMKYFNYEHLPEHLQAISKPIGDLARQMDESLPDGPEKSAGLRKLLEAKDCLVRAKLG